MGFMTEFSLLNDDLGSFERLIRERPDHLISEIAILRNGRPVYGDVDPATGRSEYLGSMPSDQVRGAHVTVFPSHHADEPRLYLAYQNCFTSLSAYAVEAEYGDRIDTELIQKFLERQLRVAEDIVAGLRHYLKEKGAHVA